MALPGSGSLSIKNAAGAGRSIAIEVDGNISGSKSLLSLSLAAGKTAPHGMLEFYGYSSVILTTINWFGGTITTSTSGTVYRQSVQTVNLTFTNSGSFAGGTFGTRVLHYVESRANQIGAQSNAQVFRNSPLPTFSINAPGTFGAGIVTSAFGTNYTIGFGTNVNYDLKCFELGTNISVYAISSVRITSVWQNDPGILPSIGATSAMILIS